jgi:hypothetical protein
MKDDRLFRVIVLGGMALAATTASLAGCGSEPRREGAPPEYEPVREGPPSLPREGPPPPEETVTLPETTAAPTASASASAAPTASAGAVPTATATATAKVPPREGPPPKREGPPPPKKPL